MLILYRQPHRGWCIWRIRSFELSLRELAGSMRGFGMLPPLVIGHITVCGVDPAGLLVVMGLVNIVTGLIYRLPLPLEPMKALAMMAIGGTWAPEGGTLPASYRKRGYEDGRGLERGGG